jgi:predicted O-linked N-acetylglucosamine transferase (SPINDLY family)
MLAASSSAAEQLQCAKTFALHKHPLSSRPLWRGERYQHDRIRMGYVSGEFREHATSYLVAELLELHDRSRFEVFAISTGAHDQSPMTGRIAHACEHFLDVSAQPDREAASLLRNHEIDILIDLNGYFGHARTDIFAARAAPVQVNYLGFPGTMGAEYMDYIVADRHVIPEDQRQYFTEHVVYLPDTYQANDSKRKISVQARTRAEAGLPEHGFVFCCFNNNHKIMPGMFDIWMRLLQQVEGSVLWLLEGNAMVSANLRREAQRRNVAPHRIVFAPRMKLGDHLARHRLADLFLDTLPHNAHTTASDALWVGVPVLTCVGTTFAGRVAGSLLNAAGMPELITTSLEDYEALALKLARDGKLRAGIKSKLARNRATCPLFDTDRFRRHIESAYIMMWDRFQRGEPAASLSVPGVF